MSKVKLQMRNTRISHAIKINGELINIDFARIVYRCAVCHSELKKQNAGLVCARDTKHRRFIHQREVEAIKAQRTKEQANIEANYEIRDGQIVPKKG